MKKIFFSLLIIVLFAIVFKLNENIAESEQLYSTVSDESESNSSYNEWTENTLSQMTLREKIAQMIVSHSEGYTLPDNSKEYSRLKNLVQNEKVGGFIFFKGKAREQGELINKLQNLSETPLLISADYERGTRMRLEDGSLFPNNMAIGATRNPDLAYKMGLIIAKESRAIGVHQNYAPVTDVNNNPLNPIINVRSYGEDPELVSMMADSFIKGTQDGKVIATAKHFPGHGDTDIDSHSDLPVLNFNRTRLNSVELIPFISSINSNVRSIMIAHLSFPALEKEPYVPASISPAIVNNLLISELNYDGLIVTDALNMAGITKHFSNEDVAVRSVKAGIDLILMPINESSSISAIENAVRNGSITRERIDRSARKILNAKYWLGLNENRYVNVTDIPFTVNSLEARELSQQIADESVTLVKNENNIIPFDEPASKSALVVSLNNGNEKIYSDYFFKEYKLNNDFGNNYYYDLAGNINNPAEILSKADEADVIIIPIYARVRIMTGTVGLPESQLSLINNLVKKGKPVVVVSFGNPYLIQGFPGVSSYIAAYGDAETSINSVIKALNGDLKFKGKLPVTISESYKIGTGIQN
jgi:beta-N-acetylhexosaminidase